MSPLGRGVVVAPGAEPPAGWEGAPVIRVDDEGAAAPLHEAWSQRRPVVVELGVDAGELKRPETDHRPPYVLGPGFEFARERLHFLVWANTYDARAGEPVWWHGVRAGRLGAEVGGPADVVLPDGTPAWCDGGPRQALHGVDDAVVHRDSIDAGHLTVAGDRPPSAALAPDQLAAVSHPGGPARIIAPAGSGKTRVLTERLRHLLADRSHEPDLLTAVAYNVKAAEELRERTAGLRPTIRTLNSLGLSICQMAGPVKVLEERECRNIVQSLVKIPRKANADPVAPYLEALSAIRLGLLDPEAAETRFPDAAGVSVAFDGYRAALATRGAVDFDEQIYRAVELLLTDPDIRARARAGCRTLLVDEFQDLTPAHVLLIRLLAGPAASVFGVGDDDQVIYGYAGADPGFLIDFARWFPGAATYDLQVNYRCPPAIVAGAQTLLGYNRRRIPKTVSPAPGRADEAGALITQPVPVDDLTRAARDRVVAWLDHDVEPTDIAVLARVNAVLLPIQVLLAQSGIPCTRAVGAELLGRTGIAAALAYLRIGVAPADISREDVAATVRRPSRKIARNVLEIMGRRPRTSIADLRSLGDWLSGDDAERVHTYATDLELVAKAVNHPEATTAKVFDIIRRGVGLDRAMTALDNSRGSADRSAHGDDLWALEQLAALHPDPAGFEPWLRSALTASPEDAARPCVHLSTVHKVKGREWPNVIVFGASVDLFPHRLADDVEEERRVFHVALTRAARTVVVLGDAAAPSPFLAELAGTAERPAVKEPPALKVRARTETPAAGESPTWDALKEWRTGIARRDKVPPYVVMSDAHLKGIAERRPSTLGELAACPGIGPLKLERYGEDILGVIENSG
ncbi:MAG TPA: UvrD-helicase domain-containing protein [Acidimicrobiales bacterium]|nr:UvrD-helicase domain-containing protein [Acidimicrobiales bacterium]